MCGLLHLRMILNKNLHRKGLPIAYSAKSWAGVLQKSDTCGNFEFLSVKDDCFLLCWLGLSHTFYSNSQTSPPWQELVWLGLVGNGFEPTREVVLNSGWTLASQKLHPRPVKPESYGVWAKKYVDFFHLWYNLVCSQGAETLHPIVSFLNLGTMSNLLFCSSVYHRA